MNTSSEINIDNLNDAAWWTKLTPNKQITTQPFSAMPEPSAIDDIQRAIIKQQMIREGFFNLPDVLDSETVKNLHNIIMHLHSNGIMPLFAAVYDDFWIALQKIRTALDSIMSPGYVLIPDFWIWHIPTGDNAGGWTPHRDSNFSDKSIRADGTPTLCTAWIPLVDVSTDNACMHVVSRLGDPAYQDFLARRAGKPGSSLASTLPIDLSFIRALPSKAGGIIGWDANVMHWGGRSNQWTSEPRVSIGIYYQSSDNTPTGKKFDDAGRVHVDYTNPECALSFENRLTIIANNIDTYRYKLDHNAEVEKNYSPLYSQFSEQWCRK